MKTLIPYQPRTRQPTTIEELLECVIVCMSGCWIWTGADSGDRMPGGHYGRILRPGTRNAMAAHRYVYKQFKGPIPPGWQIDHLCHSWGWHPYAHRRCVNLDHLEAVPHIVNMARRDLANAMTREIVFENEQPAPLLAPGESELEWFS